MKQRSTVYKTLLPTIFSFIGVLALVLDAGTAASAAAEGIQLCLQTVIPSLFPFLVVGKLFSGSAAAAFTTRLLGPIMEPLFGLPQRGAAAVALGAVGGYPIGARTAADLYRAKELDRESAERLLGFCSNAGAAFLFGMVGGLLGSMKIAAVLYVIHLLSAVFTGIILKPRRRSRSASHIVCGPPAASTDLPAAVFDSVRAMAMICAYIVLFRVITAFLVRSLGLWLPPVLTLALSGILELAGGCCMLPQLEAAGLRYCMASFFLAFGSISVLLQTKAVIGPAGLTGRYYLFGKIIQGTIAVLLTWGSMVVFPTLLPRELSCAAIPLPNHQGLLRSMGTVTLIFLAAVGIWCIRLRKKAGKEASSGV